MLEKTIMYIYLGQADNNIIFETLNTFINAYAASSRFYSKLADSFADASLVFSRKLNELKPAQKPAEIEKVVTSEVRHSFYANFREESFVKSLSEFLDSQSKLAKLTGLGEMYQQVANLNSSWNTIFIEPLRDTAWRSPSHKIYSENKYALFHYEHPNKDNKRRDTSANVSDNSTTFTNNTTTTTPVLVIYAFINRHYILDLLPNGSIVRNLLNQALDLFATDWGTPAAYDKELTLGHYVNNYLDNAVEYIKKHTGSNKVSLFGYCWGGNLAQMYAALHPEKVKTL